MANSLQTTTNKQKFSVAIQSDTYKNLINNTLGDKEIARQFVADISSVVSGNSTLAKCDSGSILSAGLTACSLKLPLSPTLGYCYVIPYGDKAQFQIGYKGLIQLAMRSGQFSRIGVREVHEGEYKSQDKFGDDVFNFSHDFDDKPIVGYFAYFVLTNGFEKTIYWTKKQCEAHAKKYSKSYGNGKSTDNWTQMFDTMAQKTVLKQLLSKYAPMSVDIQKAIDFDQAVIENGKPNYVDNDTGEVIDETPKKEVVAEQTPEELLLSDEEQEILNNI